MDVPLLGVLARFLHYGERVLNERLEYGRKGVDARVGTRVGHREGSDELRQIKVGSASTVGTRSGGPGRWRSDVRGRGGTRRSGVGKQGPEMTECGGEAGELEGRRGVRGPLTTVLSRSGTKRTTTRQRERE
jgi:hypothetical protein